MNRINGGFQLSEHDERLRVALLKQHRLYFDYKQKTLKPEWRDHLDCPVCGSNKSRVVFQKDWFRFCKCNDCSMVYLNPRLNGEATHAFYNGEWTFLYNEAKFVQNEEAITDDDRINLDNFEVIERLVGSRRGNILEIGPGGRAKFLRAAKEQGFSAYAVEIGEDNVRSLKKFLGDKVYEKDLLDVGFESNTFDIVYMRDVFEHVLNPRPLLVEINRIMRRGGIVSIEVPNINGVIYKLVRENHTVLFGFAHVNYWSPETLGKVLNLTGFRVIEMRHRSDDFRILPLAMYFLGQLTFTTIRRRRVGLTNRLFIGLIRRAVRFMPVKIFDDMLPLFANSIKRGSVLNVIAVKNENLEPTRRTIRN